MIPRRSVLALAGVLGPLQAVALLLEFRAQLLPGRPRVQLHGDGLVGPVRVDTAEVRPAGHAQVHVPQRVGQAVLAHHLVQPVLGDGAPLGDQRVHGVDDVRAGEEPGLVQLPHHGGGFAVTAADGLGEQAPHRARVVELGDGVREGARHRRHRHPRDPLRRGHPVTAHEPGETGRAQPPCARHHDVDPVEGEQWRNGHEVVQGQCRKTRDHRVGVRGLGRGLRGVRLVGGGLRGHGDSGTGLGTARVQEDRVQSFVGGGLAGVEQVHAGQELLPGAARAALLVQGRGVDPVRLELGGAQDALPAAVEVLEGAGGQRGVVVHDLAIPGAGLASNRCYTLVDKKGQACPKVRAFDCREGQAGRRVTAGSARVR